MESVKFWNMNLLPGSIFLLSKTWQILIVKEALFESYQNFGKEGQPGLKHFPNGLPSLS